MSTRRICGFLLATLALAPAAFGMGGPRSPELGSELLQSQMGLPPALYEPIKKEIELRKTPGYYFVLVGFEGPHNQARDSHTFAGYVSVDAKGQQSWSTISWLPTTFGDTREICVFDAPLLADLSPRCPDVPGRRYGFVESLDWARAGKRSVAFWGPYRITPELYQLAQKRMAFLDSGAIQYAADDRRTRASGEAINCLHAISDLEDLAPEGGFGGTGLLQWGIPGTRGVIDFYARKGSRWFIDPVDAEAYRYFMDPSAIPDTRQPHPGHP